MYHVWGLQTRATDTPWERSLYPHSDLLPLAEGPSQTLWTAGRLQNEWETQSRHFSAWLDGKRPTAPPRNILLHIAMSLSLTEEDWEGCSNPLPQMTSLHNFSCPGAPRQGLVPFHSLLDHPQGGRLVKEEGLRVCGIWLCWSLQCWILLPRNWPD